MARSMQAKSKLHKSATNMVVMAEHQAASKSFDRLFTTGMALVDKVSCYFSGLTESETEYCQSPAIAEFFEKDRKRLGAVAMQMAAWLWLERALREEDMSAETVAEEKKKLVFSSKTAVFRENSKVKQAANDSVSHLDIPKSETAALQTYEACFALLPENYQSLAREVETFVNRIQCMDKAAQSSAKRHYHAPNPVSSQWDKLHHAFKKKK